MWILAGVGCVNAGAVWGLEATHADTDTGHDNVQEAQREAALTLKQQ